MPPRNLTVIVCTAILSVYCYLKVERNRYAANVSEAMEMVSDYYVGEVDKRALFEDAMSGMVSNLDDYSGYISPDDLKQMNASLDQEFGGFGVEVEKKDAEQPLVVLSPLVGTPAYRAGIRAGDRILEVDGVSLQGMNINESVKYMRGEPGSQAVLLIERDSAPEPFEVKLVREVITVDSVLGDTRNADGSWGFQLEENPRIAYLRVITFGQHTVSEVSDVLATTDYEAIIIDLRNNAGGLLDAAVGTCDLFIDDGRIVSTNGRHGKLRSSFDASGKLAVSKEIPMVVLVNGWSASASEIVAACLQDYERAVIIGQRSFGKGTVQNILELERGRSALKLTTATYWRPSGKNIHRDGDAKENANWGVRPNEGFEIILSEEDAAKASRTRRARDRFGSPPDANPEDSTPEDSTPEDSIPDDSTQDGNSAPENEGTGDEEPFDDPQVRRAIDHLEQQLREKDAQSQTASLQSQELFQLGIEA